MEEATWMRQKLMDEKDYEPYCGNDFCRTMPRTRWIPSIGQFRCPHCGWTSGYPEDFIERFRKKWNK